MIQRRFDVGVLEATPERQAWHASSSPRETIARPKISQIERKAIEIGAWQSRRCLTLVLPRFWLDLISLVPYSLLPVSEKAGLLRFVKLARLMRLLRAFKSPRILANLYKHITFHNRTQTLVKYVSLLLVTIHWSACLLMLATSIHLDACGKHHARCSKTVLTASKFWEAAA